MQPIRNSYRWYRNHRQYRASLGAVTPKSVLIGHFRHDLGKEMRKENFRIFSPTTSNSSTKIAVQGRKSRPGASDREAM